MAHVIDCFGFARTMFGSDWTVSELTHRYPDWVAILAGILGTASHSEQQAFYRETALRTSGLAACKSRSGLDLVTTGELASTHRIGHHGPSCASRS